MGLVSGSKDFVTGLKRALQRRFDPDSFTVSVVERESGGTALVPQVGRTYVLRIHNWSAFTFLRWLYYGPDLLCLERKRSVAEQLFRIYRGKTDQDERRLLTAEAIRLRRQKFSHGKIMEFLNISRTQAKNYTRSEKGVVAMSRTYARKTDEAVVAEMRRLKQEGFSPGLISERLGVPLPTVVDNAKDIDVLVTQTPRPGAGPASFGA